MSIFNPREIQSNRETSVAITATGQAIASYFPADSDSSSAQHVIDEVLNLNMNLMVDNRRRVYSELLDHYRTYARSKHGRVPAAKLRSDFAAKVRDSAWKGHEYASTFLAAAKYIETGAHS